MPIFSRTTKVRERLDFLSKIERYRTVKHIYILFDYFVFTRRVIFNPSDIRECLIIVRNWIYSAFSVTSSCRCHYLRAGSLP